MTATAAAPARTAPDTLRRRRAATWVAIGVVLLLVGGIGAALAASLEWSRRGMLDPESAGPSGTQALAEILRDRGVDVEVVRSHEEVLSALEDGPATLVLPDTPALSDDGVRRLTDAATDVLAIDPRSRTLDLLVPGSAFAPAGQEGLTDPGCDLADAVRSGPIEPGALFSPGEGADAACYPAANGYALLVHERDEGRAAVVDGTALFTNEFLAEDGNAALAVNLLGRLPQVIWYQPGPGDTDLADTEATLGEVTPPWVSPAIVLLLVAGIAAAVWRGRRFGPLVPERLPVTVRASETTEGRARLYAQSRDAVHAADQLRLGALSRLSRALGLGPAATAPDIADAAAAVAGIDRGEARGILLDDIPSGDGDLVALSLRLRQLEDAVHAATRPERNRR